MSFLVTPFTYLSYLTTPMAILSGTTVLGITQYPLHPVESAVSLILTPFPSLQRRSKYYLRLGTYLGCMVAVAYCAMFAAAGMSLVGMRFDVQWVVARSFYGIVSWVMGLRIEFVKDKDGKTGEEYLATKPAVLMMNHQSVFDIYFVGKLMPRRSSIMSKSSLKFSPLGPFMLLSGTIFIDRSKATSAIKSIQAAGRQMVRLGLGLWMFPEGTRHSSEKGEMLPFKKGGFHLAIESGIPVVPIVAENYWWAFRGGVFETGVLKVKVLPPVPTNNLNSAEATALATRVREDMQSVLTEISVKLPVPPPSSKPEPAPVVEDIPAPTPVAVAVQPEPQVLEEIAETQTAARERTISSSSLSGSVLSEDDLVLVDRP